MPNSRVDFHDEHPRPLSKEKPLHWPAFTPPASAQSRRSSGWFCHRPTHKALLTKRIGFGDLRRLQRDILPDGITTRDEAEVLIALDRAIERIDKAWTEALVARVTRFVVWASDPPGTLMRRRVHGSWLP